jgi:hypothetical protein
MPTEEATMIAAPWGVLRKDAGDNALLVKETDVDGTDHFYFVFTGPDGNQMPLPGLCSGRVGCGWTAEQPTTSCSEPSTTTGLLTNSVNSFAWDEESTK